MMNEFDYENAWFLGSRYSDTTRNVKEHQHEYYELNFLTRGKTKMRINGRVFEYESYDFLLIPPMMQHLLYESEYEKFDNYVIWFQKSGQQVFENQIIKLHDYDGTVQFLCKQIYQTYISTGMENRELIDLYLKAVLWHMKSGIILSTNKSSKREEDIVDLAIKYINVNIFNTRLTVKNIAYNLNISPAYFTRLFKKKVCISPVKYINEVKIAEAKRLLIEEQYSIKEISSRLHYVDPFYFSKQFSQLTGLSPTQYRHTNSQK